LVPANYSVTMMYFSIALTRQQSFVDQQVEY